MGEINDFHGVADAANVEYVAVKHCGFPHYVVVATREINQGDEFLVDYGEDFIAARAQRGLLQ